MWLKKKGAFGALSSVLLILKKEGGQRKEEDRL